MPRIEKSEYTLDEFDKVYFALQRVFYPGQARMPDPVISKATYSVFKALRATPAAGEETDAVTR